MSPCRTAIRPQHRLLMQSAGSSITSVCVRRQAAALVRSSNLGMQERADRSLSFASAATASSCCVAHLARLEDLP